MTPEQASQVAGIAGIILFMALFCVVIAYAFWPGNRSKFDAAARQPLEEE